MPETDYLATVTRKYDIDNKDVKQGIIDMDNQVIDNEKFDKVLSEAFKLYEGEKFTGQPIDIQYMSKDAFLSNDNIVNSYQLMQTSKITGLFVDYTERKLDVDKYGKLLLKTGIALIANRTMDCSRMFSYPRTYLIDIDETPEKKFPKPNIRDYQRIIMVQSDFLQTSLSTLNTVVIVDIAPYSIKSLEDEKKQAIPYNLYTFDLLSVDSYYSDKKKVEKIETNNDIIKGLYVDSLLNRYFNKESDDNFVLQLRKQMHFKMTDFLTTYEKVYSKVPILGTDRGPILPYIHPLRELHLATLYIVDYYSRNRESPAYQFRESSKTHNVLIYICNNMEKIKTVYDAAIHLGFLVTQLPVDEQQHLMFVMNTRLDIEKFKAIDDMIKKTEQPTLAKK